MNWREVPKGPKQLPQVVAIGIKLRKERKALEAEAAALGKEENALKDFLIENFTNDDLKLIKTSAGTAELKFKEIPQMDEDTGGWGAIWKWVVKTKSFDIIKKGLHETACKARWQDGVKIPGVKKFTVKTIKLGEE